jgi:hypothetical protein
MDKTKFSKLKNLWGKISVAGIWPALSAENMLIAL